MCSTTIFASENQQLEKDNTIYTEDKLNIVVDPHHSVFIIKLKSNPTTGYSWFLREYNSNLLAPIKHGFQQPNTALIGAAGYESWTFRMKPAAFIVPHQLPIRFVYARPWQGADNSTQIVFRVTTLMK
jgi:inhibitor of cysteine peptidase